MSIWTYSDQLTDDGPLRLAANTLRCVFCRYELDELQDEREHYIVGKCFPASVSERVFCCPVCGWWKIGRWTKSIRLGREHKQEYAAAGILKKLSIGDQSLPLEDIRSYLVGRYDARFQIDPWRFEEVAASVYKDLGFHARATSRS